MSQPRIGYWATHEYKRVSVGDIPEFVGWDFLLKLVDRANQVEYIDRYYNERDKALVAALFETGGRVSEVLSLRQKNFDFDTSENFILVKGMPVLKRIKKTGLRIVDGKRKWETERKVMSRGIFPIRREDPLTPILANWVENVDDYLFPGRSFQRPYLSPTRVYQIVVGLGVDLHTNPHWFRSQRASQLASEYGWDLGELMEFFIWKKVETAQKYARLGWQDLARRMTAKKW